MNPLPTSSAIYTSLLHSPISLHFTYSSTLKLERNIKTSHLDLSLFSLSRTHQTPNQMGFPTGYAEDLLPKFILYSLSFLGLIRSSISTILGLLGLSHLIEPNSSWPESGPEFMSVSVSASMIRDFLPVVKFRDVRRAGSGSGSAESCAVCLHEFHGHEEIRRLRNCQHIFHKGCVDRWIDHGQKTCPLCRKPFIPDELTEALNERLWASPPASFPEFGGDFCPINNCL